MTTKPTKARKFRIKRNDPPASSEGRNRPRQIEISDGPAVEQLRKTVKAHKPVQNMGYSKPPQSSQISSAKQVAGETGIEAIKREGLTGRQLRMARRVAEKHGIKATSDIDAIRQLREKGIDPFQRNNTLDLLVPREKTEQDETKVANVKTPPASENPRPAKRKIQLPQTVTSAQETLPSTEISPSERRALEIAAIQRDIALRRRKKMGLLLVRLAFFVIFPTFLSGYYFYRIATPMYATESSFLIIQNEGSGGVGALGGLLPTQFATNSDAIATQGYLQSKDAMLRLDQDLGYKSHFQRPDIDPIQRLAPDASNEEAYKLYTKNVKIGYDPTEGMIRMEVIAVDPEVSAEFSRRLISYAQERVNNLSQQKRDDTMRDATEALNAAKKHRDEVQRKLIELQATNGIDPEAVIASLRSTISQYEVLVIEKELELAALLDNPRPNIAKVEGVKGDIRRIKDQLVKLNDKMSNATEGKASLAQQAVALQLAQADLANADIGLQAATATLDQARTEAGRQVRYLTIAVDPVASEEPSYPRSFENTILAFLIFGGIYLMISLTASILREQVTA